MLRAAADHFSHTDTGRQRRANEDAYFARSPVFVVADGMGGAQAGEVASRLAVETFEPGLPDVADGSAEELLSTRVQEANARIHEMAQLDDAHTGMGTTITAAHVGELDVAVAHVGDSRAYRLRGAELERLTEDHSLVEEMRRRGQLTAEEADEHPQRSIITRALGPEPDVRVDTHSWRGEAGDIYLLCSDGLTSMVGEGLVGDLLRAATTLEEAGRSLVDAANAAGGRDNITVVLFRLEEVGGPDPAADMPTSAGELKTADVQAALAAEQAAGPAEDEDELPPGPVQRLQPRRPEPVATQSRRARRARKFGTAFVVLSIFFVPLAVGGYLASQAVYFLGTDDDGFVTMYKGLPYELPLGVDLYSRTYVSGVAADSLSAARRKKVLDHQLRSHDDTVDLVRDLELGRVAS